MLLTSNEKITAVLNDPAKMENLHNKIAKDILEKEHSHQANKEHNAPQQNMELSNQEAENAPKVLGG